MKHKRVILAILGLTLFIGLAACQPQTQAASPTTKPAASSSTPGALETPVKPPVSEATQTSTPTIPVALLLAPPGSDATLAQSVETVLAAPMAQAGLTLQVVSSLTTDELNENLRLVVGLPPDAGMQAFAASAPQVQFLAIGIPGLAPGVNLTIIGPQGFAEDQRGFIAGVIAAMITPDWRIAVLSLSDTLPGKAASQGFLNGAIFFCGLCNPYYGPIVDYPLSAERAAAASLEEWQAAVSFLKDKAVQTVYVFPGMDRLEVYEMLAQAGFNIIGGGKPPQAGIKWAASVEAVPEAAVLDALPDILAGKGGTILSMPYVIQNVDEALFSTGKQQRAMEILADLINGFIDTGVDALTGENR